MRAMVAAIHVITLAIALSDRIISVPVLSRTRYTGLSERLVEFHKVLTLARCANVGLTATRITGTLRSFASGYLLLFAPWSFRLKRVKRLRLGIDTAAFCVARARVTGHCNIQRVPALQRFNTLAVVLMLAVICHPNLRRAHNYA